MYARGRTRRGARRIQDWAELVRARAHSSGAACATRCATYDESLRHASPLEGTTWRHTTQEVDLGDGVVIPAGASVLAVLAAANRDPLHFPEPDAFRPDRYLVGASPGGPRTAPHTAFGHGPHFCVGSRLARLEATIALPRLFASFPGLRLATDPAELPYRPGLLVRGPRRVPVTTGRRDVPADHLAQHGRRVGS